MLDEDIICTCMSVSIKDIKKAIDQGASTFSQIQDATGVGTVCGACTDDAEMLIQELLKDKQ